MEENPYQLPKIRVPTQTKPSSAQFAIRAMGVACNATLLLFFLAGAGMEIRVLTYLATEGQLQGSQRFFCGRPFPAVVLSPIVFGICLVALAAILWAIRAWIRGAILQAILITCGSSIVAIVLILGL